MLQARPIDTLECITKISYCSALVALRPYIQIAFGGDTSHILSYLSLASLDAAWHTCRDWWTKILSNRWVLSSVLGVNEKKLQLDGSFSAKLSHRDLLKTLDCVSDLPSTSQHPNTWRRASDREIWRFRYQLRLRHCQHPLLLLLQGRNMGF